MESKYDNMIDHFFCWTNTNNKVSDSFASSPISRVCFQLRELISISQISSICVNSIVTTNLSKLGAALNYVIHRRN